MCIYTGNKLLFLAILENDLQIKKKYFFKYMLYRIINLCRQHSTVRFCLIVVSTHINVQHNKVEFSFTIKPILSK